MVVEIHDKIEAYQHESENAQQVIKLGSDEHLDFLNEIKKELDKLTTQFTDLNDYLFTAFNNLSDDDTLKAYNRLLKTHSFNVKLIAEMRSVNLHKDLSSSYSNFYSQHEQLREILHDVKNFRIDKTDDLDSLLEGLNSF